MSDSKNQSNPPRETATKAAEFIPAIAVSKPASPPDTRALEFIPAVVPAAIPVTKPAESAPPVVDASGGQTQAGGTDGK